MLVSSARFSHFHCLTQITAVLVSLVLCTAPLCAQQAPATARPGLQKNASAKPADPVFETLLSEDSYKVYGEVRNVGTLLSTGGAGEIVDPILKLADPPKEFTALIKFLNANAEMLAGSRLMFATWPARTGIPNAFVAIEMSSPEDAIKFEPKLNRLLPVLLPTPTPTPAATPTVTPAPNVAPAQSPTRESAGQKPSSAQTSAGDQSSKAKPPEMPPVRATRVTISERPPPAGPPFVVTRSGSFVFVTDRAFKLENLRPKGSKLLSEDQNFRLARDRFSSESIFIYVNVALVDQTKPKPPTKEEIAAEEARILKEQEEETANEAKKAESMANQPEQMASPEPEASPQPDSSPVTRVEVQPPTAVLGTVAVDGTPAPTPTQSQQAQMAAFSQFGTLIGLLGGGEPEWPDAVGLAVSQETDDYVIRALLIGPQNAKRLVVPFAPQLLAGRGFVPNAPSVLPDETEMFVSASFDLPKTYEAMLAQLELQNKERMAQLKRMPAKMRYENDDRPVDPFAEFEKKGTLKIKDELLPALGNEIAFAGSMTSLNGMAGLRLMPSARPAPKASPETAESEQAKKKKQEEEQSGPMLLISITDREAARRLMPRVLEGLGIGEANLVAQSERHDDTELVNFAGAFAYAFVGDFMIISTTPAIRHVIDRYLNHQTLSSNSAFRNFTRWQPHDMIGQIYVSPALMETYQKSAHDPSQMMPVSMREYLMRLNPAPQAITYALSNDGFGAIHELHLPKSFVIASIAGAASVSKEPPPEMNEQIAMSMLRGVQSAEATYQATEGNGSFASLDQLTKTNLISKDLWNKYGYRLEVNAFGDRFEATATPIEYAKTGRRSFYIDQTGVLRGDDHAGGNANVGDKPVQGP